MYHQWMPMIAMWQQYFERAPRQREMSTLSCGVPQGSACYWDLTTQLSNSGVCFLRDNWKVLILPFFRGGSMFVKKWNKTKQGDFDTRSAERRESFDLLQEMGFFPQRHRNHTYFIISIWLPLHWIYPGSAGNVEHLINFIRAENML